MSQSYATSLKYCWQEATTDLFREVSFYHEFDLLPLVHKRKYQYLQDVMLSSFDGSHGELIIDVEPSDAADQNHIFSNSYVCDLL